MSYGAKLLLKIIVLGLLVLILSSLGTYYFSYKMLMNRDMFMGKSIADEVSRDLKNILTEKVKTIKSFSIAPVLLRALGISNSSYSKLGDSARIEKIAEFDQRWKKTIDKKDEFIKKYTDNDPAKYLRTQQIEAMGEYGEIFLTNKYGALVASTEKLTTFSHRHKYWWQGAYNKGYSRVFFDDRGYDDSVRGYVLGIVAPIIVDDEFVGILKANINIIGSLSDVILSFQNPDLGKFSLIRSGGRIIFEENVEPLSKRIPESLKAFVQMKGGNVRKFDDGSIIWIVSYSEVKMTTGTVKYGFGGRFESIDHKKGNRGESWVILNYRKLDRILQPLNELIENFVKVGIFSIFILAIGAFLLGDKSVKPIKNLTKSCLSISDGKFDVNIDISRSDEIGTLANAFNKMASDLKSSVVSREELLKEVEVRNRAESELKKLKDSLENQVSVKTRELNENITDLNRVFDTTHERELRIRELFEENEKLKKRLKGEGN